MKKPSCAAVVIGLSFLLPASIKTQWHTNGFLDLSGPVVVDSGEVWGNALLHEASFQTLDYLQVAFPNEAIILADQSGFTFETRFFLNDPQAPATLLTLASAKDENFDLQLRKERGDLFVLEFYDAAHAAVKLTAHQMIAAGEWLELAAALEQTATDFQTVRLYLNGERIAEKTFSGAWHWRNNPNLFLGGAPSSKTFCGKMDEVRISATARYHEAFYTMAPTLTKDAHTLGLWNFEPEAASPLLTFHRRAGANGARISELGANRHHGNAIVLEWKTAIEQGLENFIIERRDASVAGKFERCGYMPAMGNSKQSQHYRFVDTPPAHERYYYRLRVVDQNGHSGYSDEAACDLSNWSAGLMD